jgi:hypothetical protein
LNKKKSGEADGNNPAFVGEELRGMDGYGNRGPEIRSDSVPSKIDQGRSAPQTVAIPAAKAAIALKAVAVVVIAAVFLGTWFALPNDHADKSSVASAGNFVASSPPAVVNVKDVCPFEGCLLGKWLLLASIPVYDVPGGAVIRHLSPGESLNAMSSEVRALPRKAVVTRTYTSDEEQGLHVGKLVYVLYPIGEGAVAVWDKGRVIHGSLDLTFRFEGIAETARLEWNWWVEVRLGDGAVVWVRNPQGKFSGMDRLSGA